MPLTMPITDPFDTGTIESPYIYCSLLALDFATKTGRINLAVHRSRDAAYSGKPAIANIGYDITPYGVPASYQQGELITPEVQARPAVIDPISGAILVPAVEYVPAVYGDPILIAPAFPSFDELLAANADAFTSVGQAVYMLALSRPEFKNATVIS